MNLKYFCPPCDKKTKYTEIKKHYSEEFQYEFSILECTECKTLMTHPFLTTEQLDDYYQDEEINGEGKYRRWKKKYRYIHNWINKFVNLENINVVEIGSNSGNLLRYFKETSNCKVLGIELSKKCKSYSESINKVPVFNDYLSKYNQIYHEKTDLALLVHTFEHILEPDKFLEELKTIIKNNGHIYIEIPNGRMKEFELLADIANPLCIPFHSYLYNMDSVESILTKHGFTTIAKRYYSKKEDGGSITNAYVLYMKNFLKKLLGDNILATILSGVIKPFIRFYPNRFIISYIMSKFNKSGSIAILCKKVS